MGNLKTQKMYFEKFLKIFREKNQFLEKRKFWKDGQKFGKKFRKKRKFRRKKIFFDD